MNLSLKTLLVNYTIGTCSAQSWKSIYRDDLSLPLQIFFARKATRMLCDHVIGKSFCMASHFVSDFEDVVDLYWCTMASLTPSLPHYISFSFCIAARSSCKLSEHSWISSTMVDESCRNEKGFVQVQIPVLSKCIIREDECFPALF